jgi:hypothetical protein
MEFIFTLYYVNYSLSGGTVSDGIKHISKGEVMGMSWDFRGALSVRKQYRRK